MFSDGEDNSSGHHMLEAIEAAQTNDVLLFPIRYTEKLKGGPIARNRYGTEVMARIAKETGGADFDARAKDLAVSFERLARNSIRRTISLITPPIRKATTRFAKFESA